jgi:hypothetical protein
VGGIWTSLCFFSFPSSLPGGSFFGARFVGVGVGVLLEPCDSSDDDDDDGDDTASDVFIRFSAISDMKSRIDLRELGLFFDMVCDVGFRTKQKKSRTNVFKGAQY